MQSIIKSNACYSDVIEDVQNLTRNFSLNDFVIIIAGLNDFKFKNKHPSFINMNQRLKYCTHTNIIFTSIPFIKGVPNVNVLIHKFNVKLHSYAERLNHYGEGLVSFCNINNNDNLMQGAKLVSQIMSDVILEHNPLLLRSNKNLIFVNIVESRDKTQTENERNETMDNFLYPRLEELVLEINS